MGNPPQGLLNSNQKNMKQTLLEKAKQIPKGKLTGRIYTPEEFEVIWAYLKEEITPRQAFEVLFSKSPKNQMTRLYTIACFVIRQAVWEGKVVVK